MSVLLTTFDVPVDDFDVSIPGSGEGAPLDTSIMLPDKRLQVTGTFTGTLQLEESLDGDTWTKIGSDITQAGWVTITTMQAWLRIVVAAYTTGVPVVNLHGLRQSW